MSLLANYSQKYITYFKDELTIALRCAAELDYQYAQPSHLYKNNETMYLGFVKKFNEKYTNVNLVVTKKSGQYVHLIIRNKSPQHRRKMSLPLSLWLASPLLQQKKLWT